MTTECQMRIAGAILVLLCGSLSGCHTTVEDLCDDPEAHVGLTVEIHEPVQMEEGTCTEMGGFCVNGCGNSYGFRCPDPIPGSSNSYHWIRLQAAPDSTFPTVTSQYKKSASTRMGCVFNECEAPQCTPAPSGRIEAVTGTFRMPHLGALVIEVDSLETNQDDVAEPGCAANKDCQAGQYCFFVIGCGKSGRGKCMTLKPYIHPTNCSTAPVCGCDGKSYADGCALFAAGVSLKALGACP